MKKELLDNALNQPISITLRDYEDQEIKGYLVKDEHNPQCYKILPLDIHDCYHVFFSSYVEKFTYLISGFTVK